MTPPDDPERPAGPSTSAFGDRDRASSIGRRRESVAVVRTLDEFLRVSAVRAMVYVQDQDCPFEEEFDGNDFCAMHLLGMVDGEPAACLRIRFFSGFAKVERLAVRTEHRRSRIAFKVVRFALKIIARKGYSMAYGHARESLEDFWGHFGARQVDPGAYFTFSGQRYSEMILDLEPARDAVRLGDDPMVLIRPEGDWDQPGVLEGTRGFGPSLPLAPQKATGRVGRASPSEPWPHAVAEAWRRWTGEAPATVAGSEPAPRSEPAVRETQGEFRFGLLAPEEILEITQRLMSRTLRDLRSSMSKPGQPPVLRGVKPA